MEVTLPGNYPTSELIICFVHGFQSSGKTFGTLPKDLGFKYLIFEYESIGQNQPQQLSSFINENTLAGSVDKVSGEVRSITANVVLVAHSMGGIVSMDCLKLAKNPNIIGLIAFDTPFFSVDLFGTHSKITNSIQKFKPTGWGLLGAALATGGALALAAHMSAEQQKTLKDSVLSTSEFLGPLWQVDDQIERFELLKQRSEIYFAAVYLELQSSKERFCLLPPADLQKYFEPLVCDGEYSVDVHMQLFDISKPWYIDLLCIAKEKINACIYHHKSS